MTTAANGQQDLSSHRSRAERSEVKTYLNLVSYHCVPMRPQNLCSFGSSNPNFGDMTKQEIQLPIHAIHVLIYYCMSVDWSLLYQCSVNMKFCVDHAVKPHWIIKLNSKLVHGNSIAKTTSSTDNWSVTRSVGPVKWSVTCTAVTECSRFIISTRRHTRPLSLYALLCLIRCPT